MANDAQAARRPAYNVKPVKGAEPIEKLFMAY